MREESHHTEAEVEAEVIPDIIANIIIIRGDTREVDREMGQETDRGVILERSGVIQRIGVKILMRRSVAMKMNVQDKRQRDKQNLTQRGQ